MVLQEDVPCRQPLRECGLAGGCKVSSLTPSESVRFPKPSQTEFFIRGDDHNCAHDRAHDRAHDGDHVPRRDGRNWLHLVRAIVR